MSVKDRCDWRNVGLLIDDEMQRQYAQLPCGDSRRDALEDRMWYYARTLYSLDGNDSRTEHYARKTMEMMLRDAPDMLTDSVLRPSSRAAGASRETYLQFLAGHAAGRSRGVALLSLLSPSCVAVAEGGLGASSPTCRDRAIATCRRAPYSPILRWQIRRTGA